MRQIYARETYPGPHNYGDRVRDVTGEFVDGTVVAADSTNIIIDWDEPGPLVYASGLGTCYSTRTVGPGGIGPGDRFLGERIRDRQREWGNGEWGTVTRIEPGYVWITWDEARFKPGDRVQNDEGDLGTVHEVSKGDVWVNWDPERYERFDPGLPDGIEAGSYCPYPADPDTALGTRPTLTRRERKQHIKELRAFWAKRAVYFPGLIDIWHKAIPLYYVKDLALKSGPWQLESWRKRDSFPLNFEITGYPEPPSREVMLQSRPARLPIGDPTWNRYVLETGWWMPPLRPPFSRGPNWGALQIQGHAGDPSHPSSRW